MPTKQYPIAERTVSPRLAAGATYAYAALALEPASYSVPDPAAASPSAAFQPITSLPGCAARVSLDLTLASPHQSGAGKLLADHSCSPGHNPPLLSPVPNAAPIVPAGRLGPLALSPVPPPVISCVYSHAGGPVRKPTLSLSTATPAAAVDASAFAAAPCPSQPQGRRPEPRQPQLQPAPYGQGDAQMPSRAPTGRNIRLSVDAAAGAMVLRTCAAPGLPQSQPPGPGHAAAEPALAFYGRNAARDSASPAPCGTSTATAPAPAASASPSAEEAAYEWSFGDNLQRARMMARYAAMDAADELRYEPPGGRRASDGGSRKARGAWKALSTLLKSGKSRSAPGSGPGPDSCVGAGGEGPGPAPPAGERGKGGEEEPASKVVRSRDSRRLMRVHRSRVGIDREPGNQQRSGGALLGAGGKVVPAVNAAAAMLKATAPMPSSCQFSEDAVDPATAVVIAAAQEFAKIASGGEK